MHWMTLSVSCVVCPLATKQAVGKSLLVAYLSTPWNVLNMNGTLANADVPCLAIMLILNKCAPASIMDMPIMSGGKFV